MAVGPNSLARRWSEHLILGLVVEPSGADQIDGSQQLADLTALGSWSPRGAKRPRRAVRFVRLPHRRGRAFQRTFGPRRLRLQSKPALVATEE